MARKFRGMKLRQGVFKPQNPGKYQGDLDNIIYRSSWEKRMMIYLDTHPDVLEWSSEELVVPYVSPVDNRFHRYFPDFKAKVKTASGAEQTLVIEIKPEKEQSLPPKQKRVTESYISSIATYAVNQAKWKAAEEFCRDRGWKFVVMNEHDLGIGK